MSEVDTPYYQACLRDELAKRIDKNPRYSLRAFAALLGILPGALSLILSGKRTISTKVIDRIFASLELNPSQQKRFLESVLDEKKEKGFKRISPKINQKIGDTKQTRATQAAHSLGMDEFRVIADWYHYAILELTHSPAFEGKPKWIAKVLRISEVEAKLALERLLRLSLLENNNGKYLKTNLKIDTKDKSKTTLFHRKRQKQVLEKSIESLEHDPIEIRNHSSLTLCIDPKKIPKAKEKIQDFMWELSECLIDGHQTEAYELSVSLFPLSVRG